MTVIEIRPHRWGWKAYEATGVEPVFPTKDDAISYSQARVRFRAGEIRVLDSSGNVERAIVFNEADQDPNHTAGTTQNTMACELVA